MGEISSQQVIIGLIIVCVIMLIWSIWRKQLLILTVKVGGGMIVIWITNLLLPTIAIGINVITLGIAGILGIPGIIMIYMIQGLL